MKTFKNLQDDVLIGMGDQTDQGTVREIVKTEIQQAQSQLLTNAQWDFMLWPWSENIVTTAGSKAYALHPMFGQPFYFFDTVAKEYLEVVPAKGLVEIQANPYDGESEEPTQIMLTSVGPILSRANGTITINTSGGAESSANQVVITGIASGQLVEETLSSASSWSTLSGTTTFTEIIGVTKVGASWSRAITIEVGSTTLLTLLAAEFGRELTQLEYVLSPTIDGMINYRFYRKPKTLSRDNDIPDIPQPFVDLLSLKVKLETTGLSRPPDSEVQRWQKSYDELLANMRQTQLANRSLNSRAQYVTYVPRT